MRLYICSTIALVFGLVVGVMIGYHTKVPNVGYRCYRSGVTQEHASMLVFDAKADGVVPATTDTVEANKPVPEECR